MKKPFLRLFGVMLSVAAASYFGNAEAQAASPIDKIGFCSEPNLDKKELFERIEMSGWSPIPAAEANTAVSKIADSSIHISGSHDDTWEDRTAAEARAKHLSSVTEKSAGTSLFEQGDAVLRVRRKTNILGLVTGCYLAAPKSDRMTELLTERDAKILKPDELHADKMHLWVPIGSGREHRFYEVYRRIDPPAEFNPRLSATDSVVILQWERAMK